MEIHFHEEKIAHVKSVKVCEHVCRIELDQKTPQGRYPQRKFTCFAPGTLDDKTEQVGAKWEKAVSQHSHISETLASASVCYTLKITVFKSHSFLVGFMPTPASMTSEVHDGLSILLKLSRYTLLAMAFRTHRPSIQKRQVQSTDLLWSSWLHQIWYKQWLLCQLSHRCQHKQCLRVEIRAFLWTGHSVWSPMFPN